MSLVRYQQKRNFARTPEPKGANPRSKEKALAYVIQKHAARRLHYDFRLEMEGVLKSWAVPKGVPTTKGDRRLAMHVEDHPLEYGTFEGTIPEGNYGAGSVMLWDAGSYEVLGEPAIQAYHKGKIHFRLSGKKLKGEWTLVKMHGREEEPGKEAWLLIKSGEDMKEISARQDDKSVVSGQTMEQIARGKGRVWQSNRGSDANTPSEKLATEKRTPNTPKAKVKLSKGASAQPASSKPDLAKLPREVPKFHEPMKALLVESVPAGDWQFEIKWDGYRSLAVKKNGKVQLYSRRTNDITSDYEEVACAVEKIPADDFVVDGEIVALDKSGHPSFQLLQNYKQDSKNGASRQLCYYIFDLLNLDKRDLKQLPLARRKELLQKLVTGLPEPIRFSASIEGTPEELLEQARKSHIEGIIAKRADSPYEVGRRSGAWLKLKTVLEQEFVIGGYTEPRKSRPYFGALLLGYYQNGKLMFASKTGTGFNHEMLETLFKKFQKYKTTNVPFANVPTYRKGKSGEGLSRAEMRRCTWLRPELVCQVRFTEWTADGGLRHPVFLGLRDDKRPEEVVREKPV